MTVRPMRARSTRDVRDACAQYTTNKDYIVADGLLMHYRDDAIKNYSNAPIGSTLADFFLAKKIKMSGDLKVTSVKYPREELCRRDIGADKKSGCR